MPVQVSTYVANHILVESRKHVPREDKASQDADEQVSPIPNSIHVCAVGKYIE